MVYPITKAPEVYKGPLLEKLFHIGKIDILSPVNLPIHFFEILLDLPRLLLLFLLLNFSIFLALHFFHELRHEEFLSGLTEGPCS